jgi:hypothetical protein
MSLGRTRLTNGSLLADQPERAVATSGFVSGQDEPGEGQNLGDIGYPAVVGVMSHAKQFLKTLVIYWQFPTPRQLDQFVAQAQETGTFQRSAAREREGRGLDLSGQVHSSPLQAESGQVRDHFRAQLFDGSSLKFRPAGIRQLSVVEWRSSLPLSLSSEGVIEHASDFFGELTVKCSSSAPNRER